MYQSAWCIEQDERTCRGEELACDSALPRACPDADARVHTNCWHCVNPSAPQPPMLKNSVHTPNTNVNANASAANACTVLWVK